MDDYRIEREVQRATNFGKLPELCAAIHPETGEAIFLERGYEGSYVDLREALADAVAFARWFNETHGITPSQVNAMLVGSTVSFACEEADPEHERNTDPTNDPYVFIPEATEPEP